MIKLSNMYENVFSKYKLTFTLTVMFMNLLGQNINTNYGIFKKNDTYFSDVIYNDSASVFIQYYNDNKFEIEKISLINFEKQLLQKTRCPEYEGNEISKFRFIQLETKSILLLKYYNKKKNKYSICATNVNKDGSINPNLVLLNEIISVDSKNMGIFNYTASEDKKNIILYSEKPWQKGESVKFSISVFDSNLSKINFSEHELAYNSASCEIGQSIVSLNDNIYLSATNLELINGQNNENKIELLCYNTINKNISELNIGIQGKTVFDITLKFNNEGNLICGGLYSNNPIKDYKLFFYGSGKRFANGSFCYKINSKSYKITNSQIIDLDKDFEGEKYNYYLKDLIVLNNGKVFFISEQYHFVKISNGQGQGYTVTHYYSDIMINHFNFETETNWSKRIIKSQSINNTGTLFYSYIPMFDKDSDDINLIINCLSEKIPQLKGNEKDFSIEDFRKIKNASTVNFNFNSNQKVSLKTLYNGEQNFIIECLPSRIIDNKSVISIFMNNDGKESYGKLDLR